MARGRRCPGVRSIRIRMEKWPVQNPLWLAAFFPPPPLVSSLVLTVSMPENGITSSLWIALIPNLPQQMCAMTEWDWMSCSSCTKIFSIWTREKIVSTCYIAVKISRKQVGYSQTSAKCHTFSNKMNAGPRLKWKTFNVVCRPSG